MVRIGVIGYGYWGPNLVRNFSETLGPQAIAVADLSPAQLAKAQSRYPALTVTTDPRALIADPTIDAIAIATPVSTHFDLALQALQANKHVLVEKPLACTADQCEKLIEEAARRRRVLMVDHTFVYTGAIRKMKDLADSGQLGKLYYYDSVRINLGLFQHDVNVMWDLAVHDLAIMDYVLEERPVAVAVTGIAHVPGQPANIAYLTCFFQSNLIAHFHVNWLAPLKVRRTLVGGDRQMIVYDDLEPDEKIKVYDKGITARNGSDQHQLLVDYRSGDMWAPKLDRSEALAVEARHFVECIEHERPPRTDGSAGLRVVRILEAADLSLAQGGRPVSLESALATSAPR